MAAPVRRPPSPMHFFDTVNAYQRSEALRAAIELDLFTAIGEGNRTAAAIAKRCTASERGLRILCDYLVVIEFLTKAGAEYGLTDDSAAFLSRHSQMYVGGAVRFLLSPVGRKQFAALTQAVRIGGTAVDDHGMIAPGHPVWVDFARSMAPMMAIAAEGLAKLVACPQSKSCKVLDIAAGHGLFGVSMLRANPNAHVTAVDWENVLEVARENADAAGVADRYTALAGSIFDVEIGGGYDVVLIPNFLHHFDVATCERLLRKLHAATAPGGRVVTLEFVPNEDRVSPPAAAAFALTMLAGTPSGDAYTRAELEAMLSHAGFVDHDFRPMPPSPHSVIISKRP